ncbi:hypothetical protein H0H81_008435 [Sphagnurus paluster]|uniref:Protein kinase domain-containing protein n=1 Tax=Sphagnurus paluster TaxID=117069 RepID=A0A9P7G156_9AGAR|nr:hypothetical protein H0H81_008435 [Sphagnurus paluster]
MATHISSNSPRSHPHRNHRPLPPPLRIPRCFATGRLLLDERTISPRAILIEYLPDAKTLRDVEPSVVDLALAQSLVQTARAFADLGVVHTDLNLGNILFVPGTRPTRAIIIDFAESGVREDEDDEEWLRIVTFNYDAVWLKKQLSRTLGIDLSFIDVTYWRDYQSGASEEITMSWRIRTPTLLHQCLGDYRTEV